jgi:hypothetical protein
MSVLFRTPPPPRPQCLITDFIVQRARVAHDKQCWLCSETLCVFSVMRRWADNIGQLESEYLPVAGCDSGMAEPSGSATRELVS